MSTPAPPVKRVEGARNREAESIIGELEKVPGARPVKESIAQVKRERDELQSHITPVEAAA